MSRESINSAGFTLLEAIVAIVLIAGIGMVCFQWINSNLKTLSRVQQHAKENKVTQNALDYIKQVNPMQDPEGRKELGPYVLSWNSRQLYEPRICINRPAGKGIFKVGLYKMQVEVSRETQNITSFSIRQVGYRQYKELDLSNML